MQMRRKKKNKRVKTDQVMCYIWTVDPKKAPTRYYAQVRLGWGCMCRNDVRINKRYYRMTCKKEFSRGVHPEKIFHDSNLTDEYSGPSLSVGDIICIYGGKYSGMWFVNDIGFVKLKQAKWRAD